MGLNKAEFAKIRKSLDRFEESRESLIQASRHIIKLSKQIIYSIHRNELNEAGVLVNSITKEIKKLPKEEFETGMKNVALQEYAESIMFYEFVKSGSIPTLKQLGIDTANYLMGMCDFTGELVRRTTNLVLRKEFNEAEKVRNIVDDIYGEFLKFDLRGGELRKKSDSIKHNLRRIEDILYESGIRR